MSRDYKGKSDILLLVHPPFLLHSHYNVNKGKIRGKVVGLGETYVGGIQP